EIGHWIAGVDAKQETGHCVGGKECGDHTEDDSDASETHATAHDQAENIAPLGAERSAHSDFVDTLCDCVTHDAVNSYKREYESDRAKSANEPKGKKPCGERFRDDLFHRAHVVHGKLRIQLSDNVSHRGKECRRVAFAANREAHVGGWILREGKI